MTDRSGKRKTEEESFSLNKLFFTCLEIYNGNYEREVIDCMSKLAAF